MYAGQTLQDCEFWQNTQFKIVDAQANEPNPQTFVSECELFCDGLTDRMSFLGLPPPPTTAAQTTRTWWFWLGVILLVLIGLAPWS